MKKGRVLGIDFGQNTLGLAVSDEERKIVFGRGTLSLKKGFTAVFKILQKLCQEEHVTEIVFGLPLSMEGQDTPQTQKIRNFAQRFQEFLGNTFPISFQDESFTSFEAQNMLVELGFPPRSLKKNEDELAAVLILKRWLKLSEMK